MHSITIQLVTDKSLVPKRSLLRNWAQQSLNRQPKDTEVTIRIVDNDEMTELNQTYRQKNGPTNVLSFPFSAPEEIQLPTTILGDIVICAPYVNREAEEQGKERDAHWAHMIVHGICHLLGYDHETDQDAEIMESLEIEIMRTLGYTNPYETGEDLRPHE